MNEKGVLCVDKRKLSVVLLIIAVILIIAGVLLLFVMPDSKRAVYGDFTLTSLEGEYTKYDKSIYVDSYKGNYDFAYYVSGNITSKSDHKFTLVTFDLFDKSGKKIGIAQVGLNEVKKSHNQKFKALSLLSSEDAKKVDSYKISSVK